MNYSNEEQLVAVANECQYFNPVEAVNTVMSQDTGNISCRLCRNWDGNRCTINVFDDVLTSIDQT